MIFLQTQLPETITMRFIQCTKMNQDYSVPLPPIKLKKNFPSQLLRDLTKSRKHNETLIPILKS